MAVLLDTSVLIMLRDADTPFDTALAAFDVLPVMSLISRIELEGGVVAVPKLAAGRRAALDILVSVLPAIDFDAACADACRTIVERIGYSRSRTLDRMIAATALVHDMAIVTTNERDFRDVPGVRLEPWSAL